MAVRWAAAAAVLVGAGCLQQPLILPENAYDAREALKQDSLARFDTVEIRLVDAKDSTVVAQLWKGPLPSTEDLGMHLAADGQTLVYVVRGTRVDRGQCFAERVTQTGSATVLLDTCAAPDPGPGPGPKARARFARDTLALTGPDSAALGVLYIPGGGGPDFSLTPSAAWMLPGGPFTATHDTSLSLRVDTAGLAPGDYRGNLVLNADGKPMDTLLILLHIAQPTARLTETLLDWRDSLPQAGFSLSLDGGNTKVTDDKGAFRFDSIPLGPHSLRATAQGRIGRVDTFTVQTGGTLRRILAVAPAAAFQAVNVSWSHHAGNAAALDGRGVLLSSEFDQPGSIAVFPLDNPSPSLQRFLPQGNDDGAPDFPSYFEPGELAGDSAALFVAYPDDARLGRIADWKGTSQSKVVSTPFQPGGFWLEGDSLFILGRVGDGAMVLAEFGAADLSLRGLDTLTGFSWDGVVAHQRAPKLTAGADGSGDYYAVDGGSPNAKGHVLRIGRRSRKVEASRELPDAALDGIAWFQGNIYVTSMVSDNKLIRVFDAGLVQSDSLAAGKNTNRIAFATEGRLKGYGFVTTDDNTMLVISPLSHQPLAALTLPGGLPGRSVSVDGASGKVLVSDGSQLFMLSL